MELKIFKNRDFGEVRSMMINDEPWFVGKDVCAAFGDTNHNRSLARVDEEDKMENEILDSMGRIQKVIMINEWGLYSLLFAMQPQKANKNVVSGTQAIERIQRLKKFKRWITSEILPALRKTGSYSILKRQPSVSELTRFLHLIKEVMEAQNCSGRSIAITLRHVCRQFQIDIPEEFVKLTDIEEQFLKFLYTNEYACRMSSGDAVQVFLGKRLRETSEETYQRLKDIYYETALKEGWSE